VNDPTAFEKTLSVYERIVRAARRNTGLHLSAEDAWQLGMMDEAVKSRAEQDTEERRAREAGS
jgi:hypothetical protein